jgi:ATP-dependent DNA helicase PIF1
MRQNEAFDLMKMGKNIFLTGAPGSGKTFLLNKYINYLKENNVKMAVTASTGIAATHLQGVTIHSWSGIGIRDSLNEKELEKLATKQLIRNYKNAKVLIIDEISMLHKHQLDMIDSISRYILDSEKAFGNLQVILCGDFFQLPPVSNQKNEIQFAFESDAWRNGNFHISYLEEQHRQEDDLLLAILKDMRSGTTGEHTKVPLRTRYKKEPVGSTKATKLYSRNINVDEINERELEKISAEVKVFTMTASGLNGLVNGLKKSCLAQEQLKLKIGAEVMFVKNDSTENKYVNGTRGIVINFDKTAGWPVVKTYDNKMIVTTPVEWKYEDDGMVLATISQVPLRLAWAITIHKSQGMTLDAAEMDLGDVFELGMGYVALSRVRSLNGLKLMNLNELALKVNPKILQHDKIFKQDSDASVQYLRTLPEGMLLQYQEETLQERFEGYTGDDPRVRIKEKRKRRRAEKTNTTDEISSHMKTLEMIKENMSIESIAEKRGISVDTVVSHIEKLQILKQIDNALINDLKNKILEKDFDTILSEFNKSEDARLKSIYEKFEGKYSYLDIKIVKLFLNR